MRVIRSFVIAFSTYSRIPMPQVEWSDENRKYSMCFFPLIGTVIGSILWGWLCLCDALNIGAFLRGAVGAMIPLLDLWIRPMQSLLGRPENVVWKFSKTVIRARLR